jgi:hypothetical protein
MPLLYPLISLQPGRCDIILCWCPQQDKNRLHSILQRHHIAPPYCNLFLSNRHSWWLDLPISDLEKVNLQSDLDTLNFAKSQIEQIGSALKSLAAKDDRVNRLVHLPGISIITSLTILAHIPHPLRPFFRNYRSTLDPWLQKHLRVES